MGKDRGSESISLSLRGCRSSVLTCAAVLAAACPLAASEESWMVMCNTDCQGVNTCMENRLCTGEDVETSGCPDNPECVVQDDRCPPVACQWLGWGEWSNDGISGLCARRRDFTPNRCGGTPCIGNAAETMYCDPLKMMGKMQDCEFSTWSQWSECDPKTLQTQQTRIVASPPTNGGRACDGPLALTKPCGVRTENVVDCELSLWMPWSGCSASCGGGQHMRVRSIGRQAQHGGKLCGLHEETRSLQQTASCNTWDCAGTEGPQDCELGDWSQWGVCGQGQQKFREREVLKPAARGGKACQTNIKEAGPCEVEQVSLNVVDCKMSAWGPWGLCSKTCMGGQTRRERSIEMHAENGGAPCEEVTSETMPCNDFPCSADPESKDCALSRWSDWSKCSSDCGQGLQTRSRYVAIPAVEGGMSCNDPLEETRPCEDLPECDHADCEWAQWSRFGVCSQSCGGGFRARNRTVTQEPTRGGNTCEALDSISEIEACNTKPCYEECIDGLWAVWEEWGECSRTCGAGVEWRHRTMAIQASACGEPVEGESTEVRRCNEAKCREDTDCKIGEWSVWDSCSKSCDGVHSRSRTIEVPGSGSGKLCGNGTAGVALQEVTSCNGAKDFEKEDNKSKLEACGFEGHEPVDCTLDEWQEWTTCTTTCDGGQMTRDRKIKSLPKNGGTPCEDQLREVAPCNPKPCMAPADCAWGIWEEWRECTRCDGERTRTRGVARHASGTGQACEAGDSQVVEKCDECPPVKLLYCLWGDWNTGECSVSCGSNGWRKKVRKLEGFKEIPAGKESLVVGNITGDYAQCQGSEVDFVKCDDTMPACDYDNCDPADCKFSDWLDWEEPRKCEGLCSRSRFILRHAACKGKQCHGSLTQTQVCELEKCKANTSCNFNDWADWTHCAVGATQRTRERSIASPGGPQGDACQGAMQETEACDEGTALEVADCKMSHWSEWGKCSRSCGGGHQEQERQIVSHAVGGGNACNGTLRVTRSCNEGLCGLQAADCIFEEWQEWSGCDATDASGSRQASRTRGVKVARGDGRPCAGPVTEAGACPEVAPTDCEWRSWNDWGDCGEACGGGQRFRTRDLSVMVQNGGKPCQGDVGETQSCNEESCNEVDCQVSQWTVWSVCQANCGQGQQTRLRQVVQACQTGGNGCTLGLEESRGCTAEGGACDGDRDCKWADWSAWSECFKAELCGVGYRRRVRGIEVQAEGAGKPCLPATVEEVTPSPSCPGGCNAESCVDGEWDDWEPWEQCSVSCGQGGVHSRARVMRVEANDCGKAVEGDHREYRSCGSEVSCEPTGPIVQQNCVFGSWTAWEPPQCPAACNGDQKHSRTIVRYSANGGLPCEGPTSEVTRCNPGPGEEDPEGCDSGAPVDCIMQQWSGWSQCSAACGTGHMARERLIAQAPRFAGLVCEPALVEIKECNATKLCVDWSTDCKLADWDEWSQCDAMKGEMTRKRGLGQLKVGFGQDCEGSTLMVRNCTRQCQDKNYQCGWASWSLWSQCSTNCGPEGRRTRVRELQLGIGAPASSVGFAPADLTMALQKKDSALVTKYSEISVRLEKAMARRRRDLATAFAGGLVAFAAAMAVFRLSFGTAAPVADARTASRSSLTIPLNVATPGRAATEHA
mmetsp:Transcript_86550/g.279370  ORF Transcript_86550/g.279370 Transcript_86550/m.279370 type:complete len:1624 (-) Transcript_86550:274-5145(-)